ncbi:hypothetical protein PsYK624_034880 [Phanerochaete sordida]|uniref:Uncharacterized protein n=1 Tax=Phanerochaete sordida TaxID=48140 RepID=A0A9P3G4F5_9APHY|nr:hypothetical protein PsYK624_034880 [Phanerochaete sordida]
MSTVIPPHDISLSKATLVGAWSEGPLYGLSIALYIVLVRILRRDSTNVQKTVLLGVATLQIVIATMHYIASLANMMNGLLTHAQTAGGSDAYFAASKHPAFILELFCYYTNFVIGDALMAWRCYVAWQRNLVIGVTFMVMLIGSFISVYSTLGHIASLTNEQNLFEVKGWAVSMCAISVAIQIMATTLLVWKILRNSSRILPRSRRQHLSVVWMIVESGAILTATTVTLLTLYTLEMNAGTIITAVTSQINFLIPTSIFIRARMKGDIRPEACVVPLQGYHRSTIGLGSRSRGGPVSDRASLPSTNGGEMAVTVTTKVDTKIDSSSVATLPSHD